MLYLLMYMLTTMYMYLSLLNPEEILLGSMFDFLYLKFTIATIQRYNQGEKTVKHGKFEKKNWSSQLELQQVPTRDRTSFQESFL